MSGWSAIHCGCWIARSTSSWPKPRPRAWISCARNAASISTRSKDLLRAAGVEFVINPRIVRGLDYYMRTTFEITSTNLGAQNAVLAGGRYDGLVEVLGGAPVPGIGFAIGMERLALALQAAEKPRAGLPRVALIALGEAAARRATELARQLRALPLQVQLLSSERSLKSQLKRADRIGANYAVIIGQDELARAVAQLRDLGASAQREVSLANLADELFQARPD